MKIYVRVDGLSNKLAEYVKWEVCTVCYMIDTWPGDAIFMSWLEDKCCLLQNGVRKRPYNKQFK